MRFSLQSPADQDSFDFFIDRLDQINPLFWQARLRTGSNENSEEINSIRIWIKKVNSKYFYSQDETQLDI